MKHFCFSLFFSLMCWSAPLAAQQDKKNLAEYIDSLPIESTTELTLEMGFTNSEVPPNIARLVNLRELYIGTNLSVGGLEYMEYIKSGIEFSKIPDYNRQIILSPELFALPSLETLHLIGLAQYRLKSPMQVDEFKINIRKLYIYFPYKETINFWPIFQNLEELFIRNSTMTDLPDAIYSFKNLKKLSITLNATTINFSEHLNGLSKLESLGVSWGSATWPKDMSGMIGLKEVQTEDCGYVPEMIDGQEYYFPTGLLSLPNLEFLMISPFGRLELPPRKKGLYKLKRLEVLSPSGMGERYYLPCQPAQLVPMNFESMVNFMPPYSNLSNITAYSSLEEIAFETGGPKNDIELAKKIKAAYQSKKMPKLKAIALRGIDGPDPELVFKTPGHYEGWPEEAVDLINAREKAELQE